MNGRREDFDSWKELCLAIVLEASFIQSKEDMVRRLVGQGYSEEKARTFAWKDAHPDNGLTNTARVMRSGHATLALGFGVWLGLDDEEE